MTKRKRHMTAEKQAEYLAAGRGQGFGEEYVPWLKIQDVASQGRVSRIDSWKTGRTHHFLSDIEKHYFYLLEWADDVVDIREQYPLKLDVSLRVAGELGIMHPRDPKTKENIVMTTDFCITLVRDNRPVIIARTAKTKSDLAKSRVREKLKIEEVYWREMGVDWGIISNGELPMVYIRNIEWVRTAYWKEFVIDMDPLFISGYIEMFIAAMKQSGNKHLFSFLEEVDRSVSAQPGTALRLFRHLLARKVIQTDFHQKISVETPLSKFRVKLSNTAVGGNVYEYCNQRSC